MRPYLRVQVRGPHREVGRAVGEAARQRVLQAVEVYRGLFPSLAGMEFAQAEQRVQGYLDAARALVPDMVAELQGMAEGSGATLAQLAVLTCGEEFTCTHDPAAGHCTTAAVVIGERAAAGHNEDWYAVDVDANVFIDATLPDGTRFLSMTAAGYLPSTGINSHGIAGGANTLYSNDIGVGVPDLFLCRWALEAHDLEEVERRVTINGRARGCNHLYADADGRILDVEASATAHASTWLRSSGEPVWLTHTNRFLQPEMLAYEISHSTNSVHRLERAREILGEQVTGTADPVQVLSGLLRDHATAPDSICGHPDLSLPEAEREMTCASQVWDLTNGVMRVCAGPPCESAYEEYSL